jgi:NitT/TauT family transport system substrate-binding protein
MVKQVQNTRCRLLALLLVVLFVGSPASAAELETIRIINWGPKLVDFIDLYVGEENGYFAEAGIRIEQLPAEGAGDAVRNVVVGNADIAMADAFSGFFAIQKGIDLRGFYCPYTQNWMTLVVNTAHGIKKPADLKGKTVAVTSQASTSRYYLMVLLAANGLSESDVTMVSVGRDFASALLSGRADAASSWGSANWAMFKAGGIPADQIDDFEIWPYIPYVPGPNEMYFAQSEWLEANKVLVQRFIAALKRSKLFVEANPEKAAEIGSRYAIGADNLARNRAVIDYRIGMQNNGPGVAEHGMGWCDVDTISQLAKDGLALGILDKEIDAETVVTNLK